VVVQCPPAAALSDRLYQLYGERDDLVPVRKDAGGLRVTGYVAALSDHGPTRGPQHVFVNRRIVKDRTIAHAVIDAYSTASIRERAPEVHLFLEMSPEAVDVNVHPTKAEVRFRDQSLVHEVVRRALMDALGQGGPPQLQLQPAGADRSAVTATIPNIFSGAATFPSRWQPAGGLLAGEHAGSATAITGRAVEAGLGARPMTPLGQFRDTFIIAVDDEGVAIIDQHVAHERVLFERVMDRLSSGRLESQRLLVPIVVDLPAGAHEALVQRMTELDRFGFEVEPFGDATVKVTAVPAVLKIEDSTRALVALANDLEGLDRGADVQQALRRIAATTACHAAVKANDPLTYEKMTHILDELRATAYSTVCPHGRPVMLRLTRREIERNFERI
jgi:DNA mismatch repair protein MutL